MTSFYITAENTLLAEQERDWRFPDVQFGNSVYVGRDVCIGPGSVVGHHVVLHEGTLVGRNVRIDDGSVIGKLPMRSVASAITADVKLLPAVLGDGCIVGTHAIIYRGAVIGDGVLIADLATVREQTVIGEFSIIGRGVAVENQVRIGRRCKVETNAYITAMSTIGELCFIAPEVTFTNDNFVGRTEERKKHFGGVTMERGARICANATILPGIVIGADALVGAGAIVTRNVRPGMVYFGAPAREVRPVPSEQLLSPMPQQQIAGEEV